MRFCLLDIEIYEAAVRKILFDCRTYSQVAEEFRVPRQVLRGWIRDIKTTAPRDCAGKSVYDELAQLQRQCRRLRKEQESLRKEHTILSNRDKPESVVF